MNKQDFKVEEMYPLISEIISSGGSFRLFPKGTSMLPTIKQGDDSVELAAPKKLKKYDIVLYKRPNGQFVIHRIMKMKNDEVVLCGDNQVALEEGIDANDILAKVTGIYKGEIRLLDERGAERRNRIAGNIASSDTAVRRQQDMLSCRLTQIKLTHDIPSLPPLFLIRVN